jgi:hypothetical protein
MRQAASGVRLLTSAAAGGGRFMRRMNYPGYGTSTLRPCWIDSSTEKVNAMLWCDCS